MNCIVARELISHAHELTAGAQFDRHMPAADGALVVYPLDLSHVDFQLRNKGGAENGAIEKGRNLKFLCLKSPESSMCPLDGN
jgi:hypothetical protein